MGFTVHLGTAAAAAHAARNRRRHGASPAMLVVFGLLFAVAGLGVGYWGFSEYQLGQRSAAWPIVMGSISQSEVVRFRQTTGKHRGIRYRPEIDYSFEVDGNQYSGKQIAIGAATAFIEESEAQAIADRYPMGATVPVAYDPAHPAKYHVLEPGATSAQSTLYLVGGIGSVFLMLGGWLMVAGIRPPAPAR